VSRAQGDAELKSGEAEAGSGCSEAVSASGSQIGSSSKGCSVHERETDKRSSTKASKEQFDVHEPTQQLLYAFALEAGEIEAAAEMPPIAPDDQGATTIL
jgi:hypothetical protein